MRILLPLALCALSAHAMTASSTNAAPEVSREIVGNYRFLGYFCGDVPLNVDVGGSINLEISTTNLVITSNYGIYGGEDQFLSCTQRNEGKIVSSDGNLLVIEPVSSITECRDNQGNSERNISESKGAERIRYARNGGKLDLMFEGETVPLCTSGAPFIQSYGISPLHEE